MGIGAITSTNSMSAMQLTSADLKDQKSKNIQTEIDDVQQKLRKLSSDEELSVSEKANEKEKLQKEKSSLDTELKQHQEELLQSHKREIRLAELQEDRNPKKEDKAENGVQPSDASSDPAGENNLPADRQQTAQPGTVIAKSSDGTVILKEVLNQAANTGADTETRPADETGEDTTAPSAAEPADAEPVTDAGPSAQEMHAMISADSSMQLASRQGTLVTKTDDGIAVLKGEIRQDELLGGDTERKKAELKEMQKQMQREMAFQFSMLNEADNAMQSTAETNASMKNPQTAAERTFHVSGLSAAQEDQAMQQGFQVAIA